MASEPRVLILTGYGLNCEAESRHAWELAGARPALLHLADLLAEPSRLHDFHALMFIGGFSFGDHMTSGHVFAARLRSHLEAELQKFLAEGKLALGVCNGFQIMTKLGLLPGLGDAFLQPQVALIQNDCGAFQNRWVRVGFEPSSPCVFTRGLEAMWLPVRHGEGKLFPVSSSLLDRMETEGCVVCRYVDPQTAEPTMIFPANPNGSVNAIAGICSPSGRVFGLMPHPEAFLYGENFPCWELSGGKESGNARGGGEGLRIFRNAVEYLSATRG